MSFAIKNSDSPPSDAPVVYRPARRGWLMVAVSLLAIAAIFVFVSFPWINAGELTPDEIAGKKRIVSEAPMIWGALLLGTILLLLLPAQIWELLFFRFVADDAGLRWRPFIAWRRARWDEITDCSVINNGQIAHLTMGERHLDFHVSNPAWPALRDYIAARVALPDGLKAWHVKQSPTDSERRALFEEADSDAPIVQHSDAWMFAFFGVMFAAIPISALFSPRGNLLAAAIVFAPIFIGAICWPLFYARRTFIKCDDDGLTLGTIAGQRRIAFSEIDDLFELPPFDKSSSRGRPFIVVNGETIALEARGKKRWALLNRLERRAFNARVGRFERREFAPVGTDLMLPATLTYNNAWRDWRRSGALVISLLVFIIATVGASIYSLGWQNFGNSRGILLLFGIGTAIAVAFWAARALQRREILRARAPEQIEVSEHGLRWQAGADVVAIAWPDIVRLERDEEGWFGFIVLRVESAAAAITFSALHPRGEALIRLLRERSGLEWEESPRIWRRWRGVTREDGILIVRANTASAHLSACLMLGMWAIFPTIMLSIAPFDEQWSWSGWWPDILFFVVPPVVLPLWWALALWVSAWRTVTRCDATGLYHRGWSAPRSLSWAEIEEIGTGGETHEWVRARDGRIIKISILPGYSVSAARRILSEEIKRRAPHATGDWEIK